MPTVETLTEPNAETASEATTTKTFDEENTPAEKAELSEIKGLVDSAETKYKAGDFSGAKDDLKNAQDKFKELRNSATSRRRAK